MPGQLAGRGRFLAAAAAGAVLIGAALLLAGHGGGAVSRLEQIASPPAQEVNLDPAAVAAARRKARAQAGPASHARVVPAGAGGLLNSPLDSTAFESYGASGPGRWITIYANATHAFMTVAGLRFDTGGLRTGTRWQSSMRPVNGFVARHPPGL